MIKRFATIIFLCVVSFQLLSSPAYAQSQANQFRFSGSSPASYQCIRSDGGRTDDLLAVYAEGIVNAWADSTTVPNIDQVENYEAEFQEGIIRTLREELDAVALNGTFKCPIRVNKTVDTTNETINLQNSYAYLPQAVLKPLTLQQIEIWFIQFLFLAYAIVGTFSFIFLVILGYRYQLTRGDVTKITEIRQKIIYFFVGLILTFFAYPVTVTIFQVMGVNDRVQCYDLEFPQFRFFFDQLCTDPNDSFVTDPCTAGDYSGSVAEAATFIIEQELGNAGIDADDDFQGYLNILNRVSRLITDQAYGSPDELDRVAGQALSERLEQVGIACNPGDSEIRRCPSVEYTVGTGARASSVTLNPDLCFKCINEPGDLRSTWQVRSGAACDTRDTVIEEETEADEEDGQS